MAKVSKGSKNDRSNKGKSAEFKKFSGFSVKPVRYRDASMNEICAAYTEGPNKDKLVRNNSGTLVPYREIQ